MEEVEKKEEDNMTQVCQMLIAVLKFHTIFDDLLVESGIESRVRQSFREYAKLIEIFSITNIIVINDQFSALFSQFVQDYEKSVETAFSQVANSPPSCFDCRFISRLTQ